MDVRTVDTVDYHTAGEPFRIVLGGAPPIPGDSVAERRAIAIGAGAGATAPRPSALDDVRRLLVREPRGHAGMYGGFLVPPDDDEAHLGVLFWHKDGYSTACGHGTIALGAWAVDSGLVPAPADGTARVRIDVPSGRVTALVHRAGGRTTGVTFRNVPSRVSALKLPLTTSRGVVEVAVAHSGACYVSVPAAALGLAVETGQLSELVAVGREIRALLAGAEAVAHPTDPRLSGVYGVVLYDELPSPDGVLSQRNVVVFADGQIDRSPCGSGTSARLAVLAAEGRLAPGEPLRHESIIGTGFTGRVLAGGDPLGDGVVTEVSGTAYRTGEHRFLLEPGDALGTGFLL
ncbi:proline racemase family protein [Streptomyces sp. CBMA123]|uniref:proline racemase family protein n=1 Tax=Streptomyces sp. CBMA123 TaxID=1896313 RepID=UPI001661FED2|nr:proline racemase family protein [Streptomyces sp. CBMA123]MBD0691745.1 proline racemase [Streptomyces sp. CBMA123]